MINRAIFIPLQPNESLLSWLIRAALLQGCDPLVLTGTVWPQWRIWILDMDRGLLEKQYQALAQYSGLSITELQQCSLKEKAHLLSKRELPRHGLWPWVLGLGVRNRTYRSGLQFCPMCLNEDRKPFLRSYWRFAWHTACLIHEVRLVDHCPICFSLVEPQRLSAIAKHIAVCASCKLDMRLQNPQNADSAALHFQKLAELTVENDFGLYGTESMPAREWLAVCRYFITLVRRELISPSKISIAFNKMAVSITQIDPIKIALSLELLPVEQRIELFSPVARLLELGPDKLLEALLETCVTSNALLAGEKDIPPQIRQLAEQLPRNPRLRSTRNIPDSPSPRSRQSVLKAWFRFKRKNAVRGGDL
jgi:hypothetical protein